MFKSGVEIFFGKYAVYIIAFFLGLSIVCGVGWYVTGIQLQRQTGKANGLKSQLEISNASFNSIRGEFNKLTSQLTDNQEKALASHALLQQKISAIIESDKSRQALETSLLNRQPTQQCTTPKDLADAWNKM